MSFDLTNKNIQDTFQNLLQRTGSDNRLYDLEGKERLLNGNRYFGIENDKLKKKNDKEEKEILRNENKNFGIENDMLKKRND